MHAQGLIKVVESTVGQLIKVYICRKEMSSDCRTRLRLVGPEETKREEQAGTSACRRLAK